MEIKLSCVAMGMNIKGNIISQMRTHSRDIHTVQAGQSASDAPVTAPAVALTANLLTLTPNMIQS
jgi:hypothetical protein